MKASNPPNADVIRRRFRCLPALNRKLLKLRYKARVDFITAAEVLGIPCAIAIAETNAALDALRSGERLAPANAPEWLR